MKIFSVNDTEFNKFGKVIDNPFNEFFANAQKNIPVPHDGVSYVASLEVFESDEVVNYYQNYFGDMEVQVGYCWGANNTLNGLEWHKSTEINCALEDMVLLLGDLREMNNDKFDSSNLRAFHVKKGESIEIFQTTLHFCPMMPDNNVFKSVVILPRGTNTPLLNRSCDKKLIARNKWFICHSESKKHVEMGRVVGITGENIIIDKLR